MCIPSINIDGTLSAGETNFCNKFGTIYDRERLTENLLSFTCNKCGLFDRLRQEYRQIVGE